MEDQNIINNDLNNNINIPTETIAVPHQENIQQQPEQIENIQQQNEEQNLQQQPEIANNQNEVDNEMKDEVNQQNQVSEPNQVVDENQQEGEVNNVNQLFTESNQNNENNEINEINETNENNNGETNDAIMEQILDTDNAMKDDDMETTVDTDVPGTNDDINRTIEENLGENDQLNQSNLENVVIPNEVPSPVPPVNVQATNNNKRQLDLEIEQLAKHRKLLEEERRKIEEQISILENEEMNYEEPPELSLNQCAGIISKLKKSHEKTIWPFTQPVDPIVLGIPQYPDIIKNPMDLGTISAKIKKKDYVSYHGFVADLNLVWDNAITFNGEFSDIGSWAVTLKEASRILIEEALKKKAQEKRKTGSSAPKTGLTQIDQVKKFVEMVRHDPSTLSQPKYQFFQDFISSLEISK